MERQNTLMTDIIYKNNQPLKIVHGFPKAEGATLEENKKLITEKLEYLVSCGFGGIVTNYRFSDDYLQNEEDWELFKFSLDELKRMGLRAWIYDEHGYPSGNARGLTLSADPDFECRAIAKISESLEAGETKTISLPKGHKRFLYAASYPCSANGTPASNTFAFCPYCGMELEEDFAFCPRCGKQLPDNQ